MQCVLVTLIHWIVIYQLDSIICPLYKWTLVASCWGSQHKLSCYNETFAHATMTWHSGSVFVIWVQFLQHYHICRVSMHYDKRQRNVFRVPGTQLSLVQYRKQKCLYLTCCILTFWFIIYHSASSDYHFDPRSMVVHCPPRLIHGPGTKACPQATNWDYSTGHSSELAQRQNTKAYPQSTHPGLSKDYPSRFDHRPPSKTFPMPMNQS